MATVLYLSKFGHIFDCFNPIIESFDTPLIYVNFIGDVWIFSDHLSFMPLAYDGKIKDLIFYVKYILK